MMELLALIVAGWAGEMVKRTIMTFEQVYILEEMYKLYQQPASFDRFKAYLRLLGGTSDNDMQAAIGWYNPMAKPHILDKLSELMGLNAEQTASDALKAVPRLNVREDGLPAFKVFLNLADDLHGGWTNRFTTDYDSKFRLNALMTRNFCTPVFWTSELYSTALISARTQEYALRMLYWRNHPKPQTLREHIDQEVFVGLCAPADTTLCPDDVDMDAAHLFFEAHQHSADYNLIFAFLYGDEAAESLGFKTYGITAPGTGFAYARRRGQRR